MNKLIRYYNQNRHKVWIIIVTVIGIIALIQILNRLALEKNNINKNATELSNTSNFNNNYSVVTGKEIKQDVKEIIDEFMDACNNGQIEESYGLLSEECKEILYPTLNDFNKNYYSKIFNGKKTYICQAWIEQDNIYTYRIDLVQDMLATGSPSRTSVIDYYTVAKSNDEYKLNINKFIGIKDINSNTTNNGITINVKRKMIYMDYEVYDISVVNNTQKVINLDDLQKSNKVYIEDINEKKYYWYSHEILEEDITINKGFKQELSIKFNKPYKANEDPIKMVFSNIILDNKEIMNIEVKV